MSNILVFILFFGILFLLLKNCSIIEPAKLFSIVWGGQVIFISLLFYISDIFFITSTLFIYLSAVMAIFSFSTLIGYYLTKDICSNYDRKKELSNNAFYLFLLILGVAFIYPFILAAQFNFSFSALLSLSQLLETSNTISFNRYTTNIGTGSVFNQIPLIFVYLVPIYGGYLSVFFDKRKKRYCYLAIIPSLMATLISNAKLSIIVAVFFWFSGVIVAMVYSNKKINSFNPEKILLILCGIFSFLGFLFFSMLLRTGKLNKDTIPVISDKFLNYLGGHLSAFDMWLSQNLEYSNYTYGAKTFYGFSNFLGLSVRMQGIFSDFSYYGTLNGENMGTNVYTVFRFLIEDFGFWGSFISISIFGICAGYSYSISQKRYNADFAQTLLVIVYFFIFDSFLTSPFTYTSYTLAFLMFYILLKFSFEKNK